MIQKQEYTTELKNLAAKRVQGNEEIGEVARKLELVERTMHNGVKATKNDKLNLPGTKAVMLEQMELSRVRAELARLKIGEKDPRKTTEKKYCDFVIVKKRKNFLRN